MRTSIKIACICMLFLVLALTCDGGYIKKRPAGCYASRRHCEAKCCCTGKRCEPTRSSGRTYYKCITVDCGSLSDPANGIVNTLGGTTFESLATYRCNEGYVLSYPTSRTCLSSGLWSGAEPTCEPEPVCAKEECPTLEPPCNGFLVEPPINPIPGDVTTFGCLEGFELLGNETRTCQSDFTWDGMSPCCVETCRQMAEYEDPFEGSSFRLVHTLKNWDDAQEYCQAQGAKLVEPDSYDKMGHLEGIYDGILDTKSVWTGGNDIAEEGVWVWPEDNMIFYGNSSDEFTDWDSDQAEGGTAQNCMVIADPWFSWDDRDCAGVYGFICECSLDDSVPV